ncbi:BPI-like_protein [Hexamita inflata]|uniref:BPI-like protein n=1 Tax=Hexamita inflata TaxID=28002 RepID=A0AA86U0U5_9EUKA|nr:BPI-like protein [Hexamita inflata]
MVINAEMKGVVNSTTDVDQCPGHMILGFVRAEIDYESLQVKLDGGDSWLFQSIINLILSEIEDELMGTLTEVLLKSFINLINNVFEDNRRVVEFHGYPNIIKDERYTSGVFTSSAGYVALRMSGYVYSRSNMKDDFVTPQKLNPFTLNKFNNDFQIAIHEAVINNAYYTFHKYNNTYSGPTYQVLEPPTIKFMNAAGLFGINVLVNGSEVKLKLTAKLQVDVQSEKCQVFFIYEKYEAKSEDPMINQDQIQNEVVIYLNSVSKFATYQLGYTHLTDLNQYSHMMDPVEHVIRLVGPEEFICPG